jgi:ATP-binding cassette subfamily B (MDR/TAP) protein 1
MYAMLTPSDWVTLVFGIIMAGATGLVLPVWGYFFAQVISGLSDTGTEPISDRFKTIAIQFTWIAATSGVSELFRYLCFCRLATRQMSRIKQQYLRSVLRQELAWHELEPNLSAATRLTTHIPKLRAAFGAPLSLVFSYAGQALTGLIIGLWASWKLMLALMTMVPIMWVSFKVFGQLRSQNGVRSARAYLQASQISDEIMSLLDTIRVFCSFNIELGRSVCRACVLSMIPFLIFVCVCRNTVCDARC